MIAAVPHPTAGVAIVGTNAHGESVNVPLNPFDALDLVESLRREAIAQLRKQPTVDTREPRDEQLGQEAVS